MEDAHIAVQVSLPPAKERKTGILLAVLDGHGH